MKLIHNQYCSKSQSAFVYLQRIMIEFQVRDYIKNPFNETEIKELLSKLNIPASELIRKSESIYQKKFAGKLITEEEWVTAMVKYPILIERPIFINGDKAVIARQVERINEILK